MQKFIIAIVCVLLCGAMPNVASAQSANVALAPELLVTMPTPPDRITRLDERCNYIVENYWKTFNPKSSFSSIERLDHTMGTFFDVTPYATADTVHLAIKYLIDNVAKAQPSNLITLATLAEKWCGTDTSEYSSDELYFPFVEAVALNKKAKGPERARFEHQYKQLKNSRVGATVADFTFQTVDGPMKFSQVTAPHVLLFFYDPDCIDCSMAKTRLAADYVVSFLVRHDLLDIVAIYPDEADGEWRESVASMPEGWIVGAMPDADNLFTITHQPEIYYLDATREVKVKNVQPQNIISAFREMLGNLVQEREQRAAEAEAASQTTEAETQVTE